MDFDVAKTELARHAGCHDDYHTDGFLASLRPYRGLKEHNFHAVVEALLSVGEHLSSTPQVDRKVIESLFKITVRAWGLGVNEEGPLVRNRLISEQDRQRLRNWLGTIEEMTMSLLAGHPPHETLHGYCEYVAEFGWGENFHFFLPILAAAIDSDELGDRMDGYCAAIVKLGPQAAPIADSLHRAMQRDWTWYEPHERCVAETRGNIRDALDAIQLPSDEHS